MEQIKEKIFTWSSGLVGGFSTMNLLDGFNINIISIWILKFILSCLTAFFFAICAEYGKEFYHKIFKNKK